VIEFELTDEHKALQQTVREFVAGEIAPHIKEWDEKSYFEPSVFKKWPSSD
jgi:glutaryl-CoA dehydrogenase (non-decarboxylating)